MHRGCTYERETVKWKHCRKAWEGDKGLGWEAPGADFAVGMLLLVRWAHTVEASDEQVHTGTPVFAYSTGTAA